MSRVRVYIATSLDGFIAGEDDDLSWLGSGPPDEAGTAALAPEALSFERFIADVGVLLMGRRTYDVVERFDQWYYGDLPVLVATTRPLTPRVPTVRAIAGHLDELLAQARQVAGDKDIYLDGGALIREATLAGRVDEFVITMIPVLLGRGIPLFAGLAERRRVEILSSTPFGGGAVQIRARPKA